MVQLEASHRIYEECETRAYLANYRRVPEGLDMAGNNNREHRMYDGDEELNLYAYPK